MDRATTDNSPLTDSGGRGRNTQTTFPPALVGPVQYDTGSERQNPQPRVGHAHRTGEY